MKDLLKDALSDERDTKARLGGELWGSFFDLHRAWRLVFAAIFGNKAMSSDAIKLIGTLATTWVRS